MIQLSREAALKLPWYCFEQFFDVHWSATTWDGKKAAGLKVCNAEQRKREKQGE